MRAKLPLRISSAILFLFALGHTIGFQTFRPDSQQGLAVMEAMRSVPFAFGNTTVHWMDLYMAFGFALSVSGFFSAILAWRLSTATIAEILLARTITWAPRSSMGLAAARMLAGTDDMFNSTIGIVQAVFSVVSTAALVWSAVRLNATGKANF